LPISSEILAGTQIREAELRQNYPYGGTDYTKIYTSGGTGVSGGEAMAITDGSVTEYFIVDDIGPAAGELTIVSGSLDNSYIAYEAKVQILKMNDPEFEPASAYGTVDSIARYGIKNMVNQIDYSS
jgi:hypothetical protein